MECLGQVKIDFFLTHKSEGCSDDDIQSSHSLFTRQLLWLLDQAAQPQAWGSALHHPCRWPPLPPGATKPWPAGQQLSHLSPQTPLKRWTLLTPEGSICSAESPVGVEPSPAPQEAPAQPFGETEPFPAQKGASAQPPEPLLMRQIFNPAGIAAPSPEHPGEGKPSANQREASAQLPQALVHPSRRLQLGFPTLKMLILPLLGVEKQCPWDVENFISSPRGSSSVSKPPPKNDESSLIQQAISTLF